MGNRRLRKACEIEKRAQRGFTLIELMVVVSIILVLCIFGVFVYRVAIAHAKETVCKTNLDALHEAINLYLSDNDALPASLGQLKFEHLEKGYAKATAKRGWTCKFCFFLIKMDASDHAYAQFLTYENLQKYGVTEKILHCPSDPDGGVSYGINGNLAGKKWSEISRDVIVVADCDTHAFTSANELTRRHSNKALALRKSGGIAEVTLKRLPAYAEIYAEELTSETAATIDDAKTSSKPNADVVQPAP